MSTPLPLRPRSATEIVDAAFQLYRRDPMSYLLVSALCYAPVLVLQLVTQGVTTTITPETLTAIGIVRDRAPYQAEMGNGFRPFRRDVAWLDAREAPIAPLLDWLDFTGGSPGWGYRLRFGLLPISDHDLRVIAAAMAVDLSASAARDERVLS